VRDPPDRFGQFLPGMPWIGEVETKGGLIASERNAWWKTAEAANA